MPELVWGTAGERFYESGVDRGVLFIDDVGFAWSGIKSVEESPTGGEAKPFYIDGIKFLNLSGLEEYSATINAFSAPSEFAACDGTVAAYAGLFLTGQPKKSFGFSYRTKIGNDFNVDHGYKLHLVYNALADTSSRNRATLNSSVEPVDLSWRITTTPPELTGFRPTAHLIIDSRETPSDKLAGLEAMIYGSDSAESYLPTIEEILEWFAAESDEFLVDHGDGSFTVTAPDDVLSFPDAYSFEIDSEFAFEVDEDSYYIDTT